MNKLRAKTLAGACGEVLDVGFGIGFNLPHYPRQVKSVAALEPSAGMVRRAESHIRNSPIPVRFVGKRAEALTPADGAFDTAVTTLSLCTVQDLSSALVHIRLVLKRGGRLLFLEHVAAPDPGARRLQERLNPFNRAIFCGCNLNRDTEQAILDAGFRLEEIERFQVFVAGWPEVMSHMIQGVATA